MTNTSNAAISRTELQNYLDVFLQVPQIADYCPNGLQIEGRPIIKSIVTGVTACQELLDAAIARDADAILVHHGYFWKNEPATLVGIKRNRIASLLGKQINLFAYHLPLDVHPVVGNNVQLANVLGLPISDSISIAGLSPAVLIGHLATPIEGQQLADKISQALQRPPLYIYANQNWVKPKIKQIGWCTGAAQDFLEDAILAGCDAYITGEISERTVHIAREYNVHFYAAGHHATERYGIKALGEHLAEKFNLQHEFIDIDNPV